MSLVLIFLAIIIFVGLIYWLLMSSYSQVFGYYPWRAKTSSKQIAITFDDGPNDPYSSELLDYLDNKKVKVSFFLVGKCIERYPETAKRIISDGLLVANHTATHQFRNYLTSPTMESEIQSNQQIIKKILGVTPMIYRSPWLMRHPLIFYTLRKSKLTAVSGEFCHSLEVAGIDSKKIAAAALKKAKPGAILIFHDGVEGQGGDRSQSVAAAIIVIDELIRRGYQLVRVDQLLKLQAYR